MENLNPVDPAEVAVLGQKLEDLKHIVVKIDTAIEKISEVNSSVSKMLAVHEERIIHRDIKPDNFLVGGNDKTKNTVYIIDFGLAKCFKSSDGEHIPFKDGKNLTGTARYASVNTHIGYE